MKIRRLWEDFKELIGDSFIISSGIILIFIFVTIEVMGIFGKEENAIILWVELFLGVPMIVLGISRLVKDLKAVSRRGDSRDSDA